ncbi:hypothetical protein [Heyndrickxia vini]|uniref:Uncharacterized protein n=1 Tax=Heyndrickxia vini TaxID=1476025 RepID=A0ABX7E448_9BACI|nr:hypothetical protein [Heyndrickxia vini]QQZ10016.1 hypothetical protein I5776_03345 [Heyndrickxia vini]
MKNKRTLIIFLVFVCMLGTFMPYSISTANAASKTSYKLNTKKIYTYTYYEPNGSKTTYTEKYVKKYKGGDLWKVSNWYEVWKEDKKGLKLGSKDPDYDAVIWDSCLSYPLKKGKKWKYDGVTFKIVSTNKTIKTKAGTFKNSIMVDIDGASTEYYVKGIGFVYSKTKSGYVKELVKLKSK